jgi:hypothetical protein
VIAGTVKGIGSAGELARLNVSALGTGSVTEVMRDPMTALPYYQDAAGLIHVGDPARDIAYQWQDAQSGRFAFTAFNDLTNSFGTFYSTSRDPAQGELYEADKTTLVPDRSRLGPLTPKYTLQTESLSQLASVLAPLTQQVHSGNIYYRGAAAAGNVTATQISLDAAGGVIAQQTGRRIDAGTLTARATSGIDLDTAVSHATLVVGGRGDITLREADQITLDLVTAMDGAIRVVAAGTITAAQAESAKDATGNDVVLTANGGDINVGVAAAGIQHGRIVLKASGDIKELQPADAAVDIAAHVTDLQAGGTAYVTGRNAPSDFDLEVSTTQEIS